MLRSTFLKSTILALATAVLASCATSQPKAESCPSIGQWLDPTDGATVSHENATQRLSNRRIILLGEAHTNPSHHRWQINTIAALHAAKGPIALGFEMFPRSAQPILDRWIRGELSEKEFLKKVEWERVWRYDSDFYMPIFLYARQHRLPMFALNVDQKLIQSVRQNGWENVPESQREGVSRPAPATPEYVEMLSGVFKDHLPDEEKGDIDKQELSKFVQAQQTWDRAMAEAVQKAAENHHIVAIAGAGHLTNGFGIPHQLKALGSNDFTVAIPITPGQPCDSITAQFADLVFGTDSFSSPEATFKPLLGVMLDDKEGTVRIDRVLKSSVAEKAGIKQDDQVISAAGIGIKTNKDLIEVVRRQAPGTWLPLTIERNGKSHDLVAKFPTLDEQLKASEKQAHP